MTTALNHPLRRAVAIDGEPYIATLLPTGVRLVRKGHRKGVEVSWQQILSGEVVLGAQLVESVRATAPHAGTSRKRRAPA